MVPEHWAVSSLYAGAVLSTSRHHLSDLPNSLRGGPLVLNPFYRNRGTKKFGNLNIVTPLIRSWVVHQATAPSYDIARQRDWFLFWWLQG